MAGMKEDKDIVYLTPELFHELDLLSRVTVGIPVSVQQHESNNSFAWVSPSCIELYDMTKGKPVVMSESGCIFLANQIDIERFRACMRPEMDWSVLEGADIYQFLVLHEIAHVRRQDPIFYLKAQMSDDFWIPGKSSRRRTVAPKYRELVTALEADADRAAWKALYPGKSMPKRLNATISPEALEEAIEKFSKDREKYHLVSRPISANPELYVPYNHINGIPWGLPKYSRAA